MASEVKAATKKEESPESGQIEVAPAMLSDMGGIAVETEGMRAHMLSATQPQYYFCLEKVGG